jgi:hypothetical protein
MKQFLLKSATAFSLLVALNIPKKGIGQCMCDGGLTPDSVVQVLNFDSITSVNTTITFNRFNPSIGTLQCFRLASTITTVLEFDLYNKENFPDTYLFESFRRSRFAGPDGFFVNNNSPTKDYGPYDLGPFDPVGALDEVHIGPDTVFNAFYKETYNAGSAGYLGAGTLSFDYLNTSTTTLLDGSSNYDLFVRGYTRMQVRLVYYWCPAIILAANIKSFSAVKDNNGVNLSWQIENEEANSNYELQMSHNGRQFNPIGKFRSKEAPEASATYQFRYLPGQANNGKMYFRLKQTNAAGKTTYSVVRFVDASQEGKPGGAIVYPNPVRGQVSVQFGKVLNGNYKVELFSLSGQRVYQQFLRMNNTNSILFDIPGTPAGIYYLRLSNTRGNETFTSKLTVQH